MKHTTTKLYRITINGIPRPIAAHCGGAAIDLAIQHYKLSSGDKVRIKLVDDKMLVVVKG